MDFPLLFFTIAVFVAGWRAGRSEYARLIRDSAGAGINDFHRRPGQVRFVMLALVVLAGVGAYCSFNRRILWNMPDWLDASLLYWANGSGAALFGLFSGLAQGAWRNEKLPNARALVLAASLCGAALLTNTALSQRFVASQLSELKYTGKPLLQTSPYSCASTSGANVAGLFGFHYSEKEMAGFMGTRVAGTSPAAIIRGMRTAGLEGTGFELSSAHLPAIPLPSILLIYHPAGGRESHAVAALKYLADKDRLEICDPLKGSVLFGPDDLAKVWDGHGIVFTSKTAARVN